MKQRQRIIKQGTKGVDSTRKKIPIYITHIFLRYYTHIQSINITIHINTKKLNHAATRGDIK
jgi:hypothetical protein